VARCAAGLQPTSCLLRVKSPALASRAMSPSAGCGHWSARASVGQAVQLCLVPRLVDDVIAVLFVYAAMKLAHDVALGAVDGFVYRLHHRLENMRSGRKNARGAGRTKEWNDKARQKWRGARQLASLPRNRPYVHAVQPVARGPLKATYPSTDETRGSEVCAKFVVAAELFPVHANSSSSALAVFKSAVSNPSANQW
jgi:hypothetical protein